MTPLGNENTFNWDTARDVSFVSVPGTNPSVHLSHLHEKAYGFWKELWQSTFSEVRNTKTLFSDHFLRQHEVGTLFYKDSPIGLIVFSWFNLFRKSDLDHSYFATYPIAIIKKIKSLGHKEVMSMGYLSVAPDWRRGVRGISVSETLIGLATKRFMSSRASGLISYTRNDRKTHELCYRYGAEPLSQSEVVNNIPSDIILIDRLGVKMSPYYGVAEFVDHLWTNRIEDFLLWPFNQIVQLENKSFDENQFLNKEGYDYAAAKSY